MKLYNYPEKVKARRQYEIGAYQQFISPVMPPDRQLWSMAGRQFTDDNKLLVNSELDQLVNEGFIHPQQYHGVDVDGEIIDRNNLAAPDAHWHHEDFYRAMGEAEANGYFNPGIVNCDGGLSDGCNMWMPEKALAYVAPILISLKSYQDLIVICSMVSHTRYKGQDIEDIAEIMHDSPAIRYATTEIGWKGEDWFSYYGPRGKQTTITSVLFYKT